MDVLLISYYESRDVEMFENVGLEIISSCFKEKGIQSKLIYIEVSDYSEINMNTLIPYIDEYHPKIIAIPVFYPYVRYVNDMFGEIKVAYPEIHFISGGAQISQSPMRVMEKYTNIEAGTIGEGEETTPELVRALLDGTDLGNVAGIIWRKNNEIIMNETRPPVDLNKYPWPDREILRTNRFKYVRVSASRGCFGVCKFCVESRTFKVQQKQHARWRGRDIINVVDEIEYLQKEFGIDTFNIIDNSFEDPTPGEGKERLRKFAEEILRRGLDIFYTVFFRCETFHDDDLDLLLLLKKSGLMYAFLGVESGCDKTLKLFSKIANSLQNIRTIKLFEKADIYIGYGFIMFHPYTSIEELKENMQFLKKVPFADNMLIYTNKMQIFYDVPFYNIVERDGLLDESFSIENPFAYHFQDPRMEWGLRMTMKMVETDFNNLWKYARYIDSVIQKSKKYGNYKYVFELQEINYKTKHVISDLNIAYMEKLIDMMEVENMQDNIDDVISDVYSNKLYEKLDIELKQAFKTFMVMNRRNNLSKVV